MYTLGQKSLLHLVGVHPSLTTVIKDAIYISEQDFTILEGLRTLENEQCHIDNHTSALHDPHNCKHCKQADGFGHAADLVPFVDSAVSWNWDHIWPIAEAMRTAALRHNIRIKWGAIWDLSLNDIHGDLKQAAKDYCSRHPGKDFEDGPHFELM